MTVAAEINNEFRRTDKLIKTFSAITKIVVTENWIMKTSLYFVHFAHQSDSALIAVNTDSHNISIQDTNDSAQFVNIQVTPTRDGIRPFKIRINSLDFKELQDRINRPIVVCIMMLPTFVPGFWTLKAFNCKIIALVLVISGSSNFEL